MPLTDEAIYRFAKAVSTKKDKTERTSYGTIVEKDGKTYVRLDGSDVLTPAYTTVAMKNGERVMVMVKNHTAIVTGNITSPAAMNRDVEQLNVDTENASKTATDYIKKLDKYVRIGDFKNDYNTDLYLDGKTIQICSRTTNTTFKPYYEAGDSVLVEWTGTGIVLDSASVVKFSISLSKPIIGNPTLTITNASGIKILQNGKYTHGSSGTVYSNPTYSAALSGDNGIVTITATFSSTENATAISACGIISSINVTFS